MTIGTQSKLTAALKDAKRKSKLAKTKSKKLVLPNLLRTNETLPPRWHYLLSTEVLSRSNKNNKPNKTTKKTYKKKPPVKATAKRLIKAAAERKRQQAKQKKKNNHFVASLLA